MTDKCIRLENLSKCYHEGTHTRVVLDNATADFSRGEFVTIVGKSGSGKSTLLNLISGIDRADSGSIWLETHNSDSTWHSPHSGADYPARWVVRVPSLRLSLTIEPYLADQEMHLSFTYWEGAVRFRGEHDGRAVHGNGYVELTGYAASMQGQF